MKKIIPLSIVIILLISGLGAAAYQQKNTTSQKTETLEFSAPNLKSDGQYFSLSIDETNSCINHPGQPVLPTYTKTMTFPWGTKITDVKINIPTIVTQEQLTKKIIPAPMPVTPDYTQRDITLEYSEYTEELYPDCWYSYDTGSGLYNNELVIILSIEYYPVRYSSALDTLHYTPTAEITVTYEKPQTPLTFADAYELLIISPASFISVLQPLADHKEDRGT